MRKNISSLIMVVMLFAGSVSLASAQTFTSEKVATIVQVLLASGDFSSEKIIQIATVLSSLSGESSSSGLQATLNPGELCTFRYNGNESITVIQQELKDQGYVITKVDGKIGPETRAAISAFQTDNGAVKVDGLLGQETRNLLVKQSVACLGEPGVAVSSEVTATVPETPIVTDNICTFRYNGNESITVIQQELKDQGYVITKVDGKIGPETRAAISAFQTDNGAVKVDGLLGDEVRMLLTRKSLNCSFNSSETSQSTDSENQSNTDTAEVVVTPDPISQDSSSEIVVPSFNTELNNFIVKDEVLAAVRTSGQTPDDTGVFTYRMTLNPDSNIFVSTNVDMTFDVNMYDQQGNLVSIDKVKSIVSSAEKILRADRSSYYRIKKGDTISLRATAQPGAGVYYAELGRFTYTTDNAQTILNPEVINYGLDANLWRSGTVTLQN